MIATRSLPAGVCLLIAAASMAQEPISPGPAADAVLTAPPAISALGVEINPVAGELPEDRSAERDADLAPSLGVGVRAWPISRKTWTAAAVRHRPLYFEDANAERYGYGYAPCVQQLASAAHFFGTAPALPYLMGAQPPCECVYTLGHYRPGDCAPHRPHGWPCSARGAGWQAATIVGLIALIP